MRVVHLTLEMAYSDGNVNVSVNVNVNVNVNVILPKKNGLGDFMGV